MSIVGQSKQYAKVVNPNESLRAYGWRMSEVRSIGEPLALKDGSATATWSDMRRLMRSVREVRRWVRYWRLTFDLPPNATSRNTNLGPARTETSSGNFRGLAPDGGLVASRKPCSAGAPWRLAAVLGATATMQLGACTAQAQTTGSFQGLSFINRGGSAPSSYSYASGVNSDGSVVVGQSTNAKLNYEAFRWTQSGGMVGLGFIGVSSGALSKANGVSADGSVVVGSSTTDVPSQTEAFRWTQGGSMVGLGFLGGGAAASSQALGVNSDGSVIVGGSQNEAFRWTQSGGMIGLGYIGGGGSLQYSTAEGVNADGSIVVGASTGPSSHAFSQYEAFRWSQATGMVGLGFIGGGGSAPASNALGVNSGGSVVVGVGSNASNQYEAFRWTQATAMVGLGFIGRGGSAPYSYASGVDSDGSVVVGQSTNASNNIEAFRWTQATGTRSVSGLLTAAGVNMGGWSLRSANAVSGDGQFIVGQGTDPAGNGEAYVVRYVDGTVDPTPSTPPIGGITTFASVLNSINQLEAAHQRLMVQEHGLVDELLSENGAIGSGSEIGAFAQAGSAEGGGVGRVAYGNGFTVLGGLAYQGDSLKGVTVDNDLTGALAVRYVYGPAGGLRPFGEIGGWTAPQMNLSFSRSYANGAGVAEGQADTTGSLGYIFARAGAAYNVTAKDEAALSGEVGREWLRTGAYSEALSPADPFEADASTATTSMTIGKLRAQWTHGFTDKVDATVWSAVAGGLDSSTNLAAAIPGFGVMTPTNAGRPLWAEYGARVGYRLNANALIDVFADGVSGGLGIGTAVHVGADFKYMF